MTRFHRSAGFSLIEVMVVVAALSVAASLLVPRFLRHQLMMRQEECHKNLRSLQEQETKYFKSHRTYSDDLQQLPWAPEGRPLHTYQFVKSTPQSFLFECRGNIDRDPTLDHATIDEGGKIIQLSDDAKR